MTIISASFSSFFIYILELKQLDINNVFLDGELKEDVCMVSPSGWTYIQLGQVCKFKKKKRLYKALSKLAESGLLSCHPFYFCGIYSIYE